MSYNDDTIYTKGFVECQGGFENMGQISIRLTNEKERELKKLALAEGKSLAEFCRERITSEEEREKPLVRESIEDEISRLKETIERLERNQAEVSLEVLKQMTQYTNLTLLLFNQIITDPERLINLYRISLKDTDSVIREIKGV